MRDPLAIRKNRVYLTGFMGSGKSTIGPILANSIGYTFIDLDQLIETTAGLSVTQIFQRFGEPFFRDREKTLIREISVREHVVIALGGGSLMDPQNLQTVVASGILVYLKVSPEEILKRVQRKNDRPLLTTPEGERVSEDEARLRISRLFDIRRPIYELADITVVSDEHRIGVTVDSVVREILPFLR